MTLFTYDERTKLDSSWLGYAYLDREDGILHVSTQAGTIEAFYEDAEADYEDLVKADSPGAYYNYNMREMGETVDDVVIYQPRNQGVSEISGKTFSLSSSGDFRVKVADETVSGNAIGDTNTSGNSTGPTLHFGEQVADTVTMGGHALTRNEENKFEVSYRHEVKYEIGGLETSFEVEATSVNDAVGTLFDALETVGLDEDATVLSVEVFFE